MNQNICQKGEMIVNISNANNVYIFLENDKNENIVIKTPMWAETLGLSYHQFSYKNEIIPIVGREKEKKWIRQLLNEKEYFKVSAITGRAGNGKSSLVYDLFKDNSINQEWSMYGLSYEELQYFNYQKICQWITNGIVKKKILFIIDYVSINANQIGKWIKQLYVNSKVDGREIIIRILLIERTHVTKEKMPYWYVNLVEDNKLMELGLCDYKNHLRIDNLQDEELKNIFVEYVKKNEEKYKELYGTELNYEICKIDADKIINNLEEECKTPLYIMYIADAWIEDKNKRGRNWNKEKTLKDVIKKEDERIKSFFSGDNKKEIALEKETALKKISIFSIVLNGVNLRKERPSFLNKEFDLIKKDLGDRNPNLRNLFNEVGEIEDTKEVTLKSTLPEIVGEFYFLHYLSNIINNNFDDTYIEEFIQNAWKVNPTKFARFLCRVIEDFSNHELVTFSGILQIPMFSNTECKVLYADVLREYTFWKDDILNYYVTICEIFEKLLDGEVCKQVIFEINEKYAIALLNIIWFCNQKVYNKEIGNCISKLKEKMNKICVKVSDTTICQACSAMFFIIEKMETVCVPQNETYETKTLLFCRKQKDYIIK